MTGPSRAEADETRAIEAVVRRARETGRTQWVARVVVGEEVECALEAPLGCLGAAGRVDRFFFEGASGELALGLGLADEIESAGPTRYTDVRAWADDVGSRLAWVGATRAPSTPTFFGGFGFEAETLDAEDWKSFPPARFVLPELVLTRSEGEVCAALVVRVEPGATGAAILSELAERAAWLASLAKAPAASSPSPAELVDGWAPGPEYRVRSDRAHAVFRAQVDQALASIEEGALDKVVLARSLSVEHDGRVDVPDFLERLRSLYPTCTLVAMARGDDTFLAATPELLVRVRADRVTTAALAGSAPRGRHPEEDRALGAALLSNPKERAEHAFVVDAIREALRPHARGLDVPAAPVLRPLFGIQHLETPIEGRLLEASSDVLGLVSALHPTPAVGGVPAPAARAFLRRVEGLDRGWYAAPVGWLDQQGGGDFRVALRSALVRNGLGEGGASSRSLLFAGAGLVAGSKSDAELAETRIKLRALLAPLTEI